MGGISERRPKSEPFVFIRLVRIRGAYIYEGRTKRGRKGGTKRGGASCRELLEDQVISCCIICQVPGCGREMEGSGSIGEGWRVEGTRRLVSSFTKEGFITLIKGDIILIQKHRLLHL